MNESLIRPRLWRPGRPHGYVVAVAAAAAAVLIRLGLDPWLGPYQPLALVYVAVAVSVWYGGTGPAVLTAVAGFLASDVLFTAPRGSLFVGEWHKYAAEPLSMLSGAAIISFGHMMRLARQKALEQREELRVILESLGDAVVTTDRWDAVTYLNPAAERMTGWRSSEAIGRSFSEVVRLIDADTGLAPVGPATGAQTTAGEAPHSPCALALAARDGRRVPIEATVTPIRDLHDMVAGAVRVMRDATERRVAEEALRRSDRQKDELLATVAHELRNPLSALTYAVESLTRATDTAATDRGRTMVTRQVDVMSRLVEDLLDVRRAGSGKLTLRRERIPLMPVIERALEAARAGIEAAGHRLGVRVPPEDAWLEADPVRLSQAFTNLLQNAVKYTEPGGRIYLEAHRSGDEMCVSVSDNGIGMTPEQCERAFDMFSQGEAARERSQGGLGIGLALARAIVELHGGHIHARSGGPGRGSTFMISLPIAAPKEEGGRMKDEAQRQGLGPEALGARSA